MTQNEFNAFCARLPHTTHVVQWDGADVWKIGAKVYAVGGWNKDEDSYAVSFKCTEMTFEMYKEAGGVRPAPYLASRGMTWLQRTHEDAISDEDLRGLIAESYRLVAAGLTKKLQKALGFI